MGKAFEKQIKTIEYQGEKQVKALNTLKSNNNNNNNNKLTIEDVIPKSIFANDEAKEEFNKIKEIEKNVDREKFYKSNQNKYDFKNFRTIRTFGEDIYKGNITFEKADEYQSDLLEKINDFSKKMRPRKNDKKQEKQNVEKSLYYFYMGREMVLNGFKSKIFLTKSRGSGILNTNHSKLKILMPKQMLKRLPIALAQIKAGNNSEKLLNEIRHIIYSLYQSKEITKKVYNNLIESL